MRQSFPVELSIGSASIHLGGRPLLMGIVNVTPDSFSDGGTHFDVERAVSHGVQLASEGADWLDIGGESTRPGAIPVSEDEELRRVIPVIDSLRNRVKIPLSIDTYKPGVARRALSAGATIINDVTGFRDPGMVELAATTDVGCVVMHMRGTPETMMSMTAYDDVVKDLTVYFQERMRELEQAGVDRQRIVIDPGIGFAKKRPENLTLIRRLNEFAVLGRPILLGASRKSLLGEITGRGPAARINATIASSVLAYLRGVHILRVHDVAGVADALLVARAIEEEEQ